MALLASIRIAQADLGTKDPDSFTPHVFNAVPDLERLNLRVRDALPVIARAERSLVYMAIPYMLSVHHAYGVDCLRMVAGEEEDDSDGGGTEQIALSELHARFVAATGFPLSEDLLCLFDLLRVVRNRIIHYAGLRGSHLNQKWHALSSTARGGWTKVSERDFPIGPTGEELPLSIGELIGTLMVVKQLGRAMNEAVQLAVPRARWARIAAEDFRAGSPNGLGQRDTRLRRLTGFVDEHYAALRFSQEELEVTLEALSAKRPGT